MTFMQNDKIGKMESRKVASWRPGNNAGSKEEIIRGKSSWADCCSRVNIRSRLSLLMPALPEGEEALLAFMLAI